MAVADERRCEERRVLFEVAATEFIAVRRSRVRIALHITPHATSVMLIRSARWSIDGIVGGSQDFLHAIKVQVVRQMPRLTMRMTSFPSASGTRLLCNEIVRTDLVLQNVGKFRSSKHFLLLSHPDFFVIGSDSRSAALSGSKSSLLVAPPDSKGLVTLLAPSEDFSIVELPIPSLQPGESVSLPL